MTNPTPAQAALTAAMERAGEIEDACHNPNVFRLITGDQSIIVTLYRAVRRLQAALAEKEKEIVQAVREAADQYMALSQQLAASQQRVAELSEHLAKESDGNRVMFAELQKADAALAPPAAQAATEPPGSYPRGIYGEVEPPETENVSDAPKP